MKKEEMKKYFLEEIKIEADFVYFEAINLKMIMMMMVNRTKAETDQTIQMFSKALQILLIL